MQNRPLLADVPVMTRRSKPPRERAARALCKLDGNPADVTCFGEPMWKSYLEQVDAVLVEVLGEDAWAAMVEAERGG